MNIIQTDYKELSQSINEYILHNNNNITRRPYKTIYAENKPIILMNEETLILFKAKATETLILSKHCGKTIPVFMGCNIAIANWLSYGEVQLK